jgi:hypothetical protein
MRDSDVFEIAKEKLAEFLSFTNISMTEIECLLKAVVSEDCESTNVVWRKGDCCVSLDAGIVWDQLSHERSRVLAINARIGKTTIQKNLEYSEGKFCGFHFELTA